MLEIPHYGLPDRAETSRRRLHLEAAGRPGLRLQQHLEVAGADDANEDRLERRDRFRAGQLEVKTSRRPGTMLIVVVPHQLRKRAGGAYSPPEASTRSRIERAASRLRVARRASTPRSSGRRITPRSRRFSTMR